VGRSYGSGAKPAQKRSHASAMRPFLWLMRVDRRRVDQRFPQFVFPSLVREVYARGNHPPASLPYRGAGKVRRRIRRRDRPRIFNKLRTATRNFDLLLAMATPDLFSSGSWQYFIGEFRPVLGGNSGGLFHYGWLTADPAEFDAIKVCASAAGWSVAVRASVVCGRDGRSRRCRTSRTCRGRSSKSSARRLARGTVQETTGSAN